MSCSARLQLPEADPSFREAPVYIDLNEYLNTAPVEKGISHLNSEAQAQLIPADSTNTFTDSVGSFTGTQLIPAANSTNTITTAS